MTIDLRKLATSVPDHIVHRVYLDMFAASEGRLNPIGDESYTTRASSHLEISDLVFQELR